jgi:phage terminase large subunit-like protein
MNQKRKSSKLMRDYAAIARQYAEDVVAGTIPNCKWVRLACQRHLDDLQKVDNPEYEYRFEPRKAEAVCSFIERLPHVLDDFKKRAGKKELITLQPWQVFVVSCIFGWLYKDSGLRRYRQAYICVPKKNGKSTLMAGIGLYMLCCDGESSAVVQMGATAEKHVIKTLFDPAKQMVSKSPGLRAKFGVKVNARSIVIEDNGSVLEPVIGDPGDGPSISCGILDEFHEAVTPVLYNKFKSGGMSRSQPLVIVITTAGENIASPCHLLQEQAEMVLSGTFNDEQTFTIIYTLDEDDDWTTEASLRKANPNYGVSVNGKTLRNDQEVAIQNAAEQNNFRIKHLNQWLNASVSWMNMSKWNALGDAKIEEFEGEECWLGLDMSIKWDLTAAIRLFRKEIDGKIHYFVFPRFYLPSDRTSDPAAQHYAKWVHEGHLIATEGSEIEPAVVAKDLIEDSKKYAVKELDFDQWESASVTNEFGTASGVMVFQVPQAAQYLSFPAKELYTMVLSGRIHHDGNPVMTWCVSNVVAKYYKDNLILNKARDENKIDGVDALLNALYRCLESPMTPKYQKYQRIQFFN